MTPAGLTDERKKKIQKKHQKLEKYVHFVPFRLFFRRFDIYMFSSMVCTPYLVISN